jgi:hypothetical protein
MCNGSSGCAVRRSIATNPANSTTLATSATIVAVADHEVVSAWENPYTSANNPAEAKTTPGRSMRGRSGFA